MGQTVNRVWGGVAIENGSWWTPLDPHGLIPYGYTAGLPLLPENTCEHLVSGKLVDTTGILVNVKANGFVEYRLSNAAIQVGQPRVHETLDAGVFCGDKWAA